MAYLWTVNYLPFMDCVTGNFSLTLSSHLDFLGYGFLLGGEWIILLTETLILQLCNITMDLQHSTEHFVLQGLWSRGRSNYWVTGVEIHQIHLNVNYKSLPSIQ